MAVVKKRNVFSGWAGMHRVYFLIVVLSRELDKTIVIIVMLLILQLLHS